MDGGGTYRIMHYIIIIILIYTLAVFVAKVRRSKTLYPENNDDYIKHVNKVK